MNRRHFVLGSVAALGGGVLAVEGCSHGAAGPFIGPQLPSYVLTPQYATTTIGGFRLRTRTYNGSTAGPILETRPGSTLHVRIVNQLPPNPPVPTPLAMERVSIPAPATMMEAMSTKHPARTKMSAVIDPMNNPHAFNTTNLHVHGIQTIPHLFDPIGTSNPGAMMLNIEPGATFDYAFPIPSDHPSGLHWYHPHHHGSTDVQVSGGMAGLIVVRGPIDAVPEIAAAREVFFVIQTLNVNKSTTDPTLYEYEPIAYQTPANGGYNLGTNYTMLTVNGTGVNWADYSVNPNGVYQALSLPQIAMQPGEVIRLRILNGTNSLFLPLVFPGLEVYQIGFDGVNLLAPIHSTFDYAGTVSNANAQSVNVRLTSPGNRIELLIRAPQQPGTYTISAAATSDVSFMPFPKFDLANVVVSGSSVTMGIPSSLPTPTREYPIITDADIVNRRTITYTEGPDNTLLTGFGFYIDGSLYDEMKITQQVQLGTCEEWTILNRTPESHPFHMHVNSFQLTHINGVSTGTPEVWDTFIVPAQTGGTPGSITFRVRFLDFVGKTVHHCHVLPHEDTGMMANFMIV
ncbi:MAG TPA: multicopper oxidase domain-containing protein [Candidatus Aquilonibacter sp.]|nr:multicopper oxidase domain-containing protein [Candidatus Aquilonibacter sp.]